MAQVLEDGYRSTAKAPAPELVARAGRRALVQAGAGSNYALPLSGSSDSLAVVTITKAAMEPTDMNTWRAGCGANSHVRFGGRSGETDGLEGPYRASLRPYSWRSCVPPLPGTPRTAI